MRSDRGYPKHDEKVTRERSIRFRLFELRPSGVEDDLRSAADRSLRSGSRTPSWPRSQRRRFPKSAD